MCQTTSRWRFSFLFSGMVTMLIAAGLLLVNQASVQVASVELFNRDATVQGVLSNDTDSDGMGEYSDSDDDNDEMTDLIEG